MIVIYFVVYFLLLQQTFSPRPFDIVREVAYFLIFNKHFGRNLKFGRQRSEKKRKKDPKTCKTLYLALKVRARLATLLVVRAHSRASVLVTQVIICAQPKQGRGDVSHNMGFLFHFIPNVPIKMELNKKTYVYVALHKTSKVTDAGFPLVRGIVCNDFKRSTST